MNPVLFYGVPEGCSFGSIVAFEWSGLPYQLCRIEMPAQVASDAYKRINPVAETPSLLADSGHVVSESVAILHHIGARSRDPHLVPRQGTPDFDRFNEMLAFLNTSFFDSFAALWFALEHDVAGADRAALERMARHKVVQAHAALETMLDGRRWLAGEHRSAAAPRTPTSWASRAGTISTRCWTAATTRGCSGCTTGCRPTPRSASRMRWNMGSRPSARQASWVT